MKSSEFEISLLVESYDKKIAENCRNGNVARLEQDFVTISRPYL